MVSRKAQSTLEYVTVFAAIVAAIVLLAYGKMKPAVDQLFNSTATEVKDAATNFSELN